MCRRPNYKTDGSPVSAGLYLCSPTCAEPLLNWPKGKTKQDKLSPAQPRPGDISSHAHSPVRSQLSLEVNFSYQYCYTSYINIQFSFETNLQVRIISHKVKIFSFSLQFKVYSLQGQSNIRNICRP